MSLGDFTGRVLAAISDALGNEIAVYLAAMWVMNLAATLVGRVFRLLVLGGPGLAPGHLRRGRNRRFFGDVDADEPDDYERNRRMYWR